MEPSQQPDVLDTRVVFRVYAGLATLVGIALLMGLQGVATELVAPSLGTTGLRVVGSLFLAAACVALGLAHVKDPGDRHDALRWFANAHLVVAATLLVIQLLRGGVKRGDLAVAVLAAATLLLYYFWRTGDGYHEVENKGMIELFGPHPTATDRLRSQYEERIRAAASQEERHRLARDLHDSVKQQLFAMQTAAATAQVRFDSDPAGAQVALERVRDAGRDAATELEAMLDSLRAAPLENASLVEALKKQGEALHFRTGAQVEYAFGALPPAERVPPGAHEAILRVAQEALANVARHARASRVRIGLGTGVANRLVLRVADDGIGFDPTGAADRGMGLSNMRARAEGFRGELEVHSHPGGGTVVKLGVPPAPVAQRDVDDYRNAAFTWTALFTLFAGQAAVTDPRFTLLMGGLAAASGVVAVCSVVLWRRARKLAGSPAWGKSTSRS